MKRNRSFSQWFKDLKLSKKVFYTFISSAMIPLVILQGVMLYMISDNMREKGDELMRTQLRQIAERTNLSLEVYTNLVYQIYSDNQIIDAMNEYQKTEKGKERIRREISIRLQQYGISVSGISCISIIMENGEEISYDFVRASVVDNLWEQYEDIREIEPYKKAQQSNNMVISPTQRFVRGSHEERMFHISKTMYDFNRIEDGVIGTIVMSIDEEVLNRICSMNQLSEKDNEVYAIGFILDENQNVMTYPNPFYSGIKVQQNIIKFVQKTKELENKRLGVNSFEDKKLGWTFYNVYDKDYILQDIKKTQMMAMCLGIIILIIAFVLIQYTVQLIEKFTKSMICGIQEVQKGNLDVQVEVYGADEMGQIAENFNTMTTKVKHLLHEVEEVTERKKQAEITALEAQINPHFLYNTLDSINWMAIEKQEYEISKMLRDLGFILRYSVNKSNPMLGKVGMLFALPAVLYMLIFVVYPMLQNFILSFKNVDVYTFANTAKQEVVGFQNYIELFTGKDGILGKAVLNTLIFTVASIFFQFFIGFGLALLFSKRFKGSAFFRGVTMISWLLPVTVAGLLFKFMFATVIWRQKKLRDFAKIILCMNWKHGFVI